MVPAYPGSCRMFASRPSWNSIRACGINYSGARLLLGEDRAEKGEAPGCDAASPRPCKAIRPACNNSRIDFRLGELRRRRPELVDPISLLADNDIAQLLPVTPQCRLTALVQNQCESRRSAQPLPGDCAQHQPVMPLSSALLQIFERPRKMA